METVFLVSQLQGRRTPNRSSRLTAAALSMPLVRIVKNFSILSVFNSHFRVERDHEFAIERSNNCLSGRMKNQDQMHHTSFASFRIFESKASAMFAGAI